MQPTQDLPLTKIIWSVYAPTRGLERLPEDKKSQLNFRVVTLFLSEADRESSHKYIEFLLKILIEDESINTEVLNRYFQSINSQLISIASMNFQDYQEHRDEGKDELDLLKIKRQNTFEYREYFRMLALVVFCCTVIEIIFIGSVIASLGLSIFLPLTIAAIVVSVPYVTFCYFIKSLSLELISIDRDIEIMQSKMFEHLKKWCTDLISPLVSSPTKMSPKDVLTSLEQFASENCSKYQAMMLKPQGSPVRPS